jgi:hypothetical protein
MESHEKIITSGKDHLAVWQHANPNESLSLFGNKITTNLEGVEFPKQSNFEYANFVGSTLLKATFRESNLRGVSFTGAFLTGCTFSKCDLRGADFSHTSLADVLFYKCKLDRAILDDTHLRHTRFVLNEYGLGFSMNGSIFDRPPIEITGLYWYIVEHSLGKVRVGSNIWTVDGLLHHYNNMAYSENLPKEAYERTRILQAVQFIVEQQRVRQIVQGDKV